MDGSYEPVSIRLNFISKYRLWKKNFEPPKRETILNFTYASNKKILRHELLNTQGNLQISRYNYESENCLRPNQRFWTPPSVACYVLFSCLIYRSYTTQNYVMVMLINKRQISNIHLRNFLLTAVKGQISRSRKANFNSHSPSKQKKPEVHFVSEYIHTSTGFYNCRHSCFLTDSLSRLQQLIWINLLTVQSRYERAYH